MIHAERFAVAQNKKAASRFHVRTLAHNLRSVGLMISENILHVEKSGNTNENPEIPTPTQSIANRYATASPCEIMGPGEYKDAIARSVYIPKSVSKEALNESRAARIKDARRKNWKYTADALRIIMESDEKVTAYAMKHVTGKAKLATFIQRMERADIGLTRSGKETTQWTDSNVEQLEVARRVTTDSSYDGSSFGATDGQTFSSVLTYVHDTMEKHYNFTQLRGKAGYNGVRVPSSIMPARACSRKTVCGQDGKRLLNNGYYYETDNEMDRRNNQDIRYSQLCGRMLSFTLPVVPYAPRSEYPPVMTCDMPEVKDLRSRCVQELTPAQKTRRKYMRARFIARKESGNYKKLACVAGKVFAFDYCTDLGYVMRNRKTV